MKESFVTALGRRAENQDAYLVAPGLGIYAVADGMGGHEGGAIASAVAITAVRYAFQGPDGERAAQTAKSLEQALIFAVQEANRDVSAYGRKTGQREMGTTIVVLAFEQIRPKKSAVVAWVGDSRCYRLRAGELEQLTEDHSYVAELLREKTITPAEAERHPERGTLTRTLGERGFVLADTKSVDLKRGDVLLLCTDVLTDALSDADIAETLRAGDNAKALVRRALVLET